VLAVIEQEPDAQGLFIEVGLGQVGHAQSGPGHSASIGSDLPQVRADAGLCHQLRRHRQHCLTCSEQSA
jgi:hypothetical protein